MNFKLFERCESTSTNLYNNFSKNRKHSDRFSVRNSLKFFVKVRKKVFGRAFKTYVKLRNFEGI